MNIEALENPYLLLEPCSDVVLRCFTHSLQDTLMTLRILELDRLDPAKVVHVSSQLIVGGVLRERGLGDQLVRLVVQVVVKVIAQEEVDQRRLGIIIPAQRGCTLSVQKSRPDLCQTFCHLIESCIVKVNFGCQLVQRSPVQFLNHTDRKVGKFNAL